MFHLPRDLRFGVRLLKKSPVFTATAALLIAIGVGANTLIFSVVNAVLLRPLPVAHPETLVRVVEVHPKNFVTWDLPYDFCAASASRDVDFSEAICQGEADVAYSGDGRSTERVRVHLVSPNFFSFLGVPAYLGRILTADDERARAQIVVLGYDFWQRKFAGNPSVVGRKIVLGGHPFTIIGVTPEAFNGLAADTSPDLRVPASVDRLLIAPSEDIAPGARPLFAQVFGRLRPGVSFERADADVDPSLHAALNDAVDKFFGTKTRTPPGALQSRLRLESIVNGVSTLRAQFSRGLELLMAGVALLLLMACANVAGLLLARSAARAQEIGVRVALGASTGRIVSQLLTEGLLLSLAGGLAAIPLTALCLPLLARGLPPIRDRAAVLQPLAVHIAIDLRVLAFALGATVLTAVLFALSPALRCVRTGAAAAFPGGRTTTRPFRAGHWIVVGQVGICTLLLMGAALLIETLGHMRSMNPGFDADRVVTFTIDPSLRGYSPDRSRAFSKALLRAAAAVPGVTSASAASIGLMRGTGMKSTVGAAGTRIAPSDFLNSSLNQVTPGYFETMGMPLLAGRKFDWLDRTAAKSRPVIVNRAFATHFFPGRNPVGERFGSPGPGGVAAADNEIVGVIGDARYRSLREPIPPTVYSPAVDGFDSGFILHVRTKQSPATVIAPIRELLHSLDPQMPLIEARTLREEVEASLWQERLLAALSAIFGAIAALLASIGLYGTLDYAVRSRLREIGVRAALGAEPSRIAALFSRQAFLLTAGGVALGLCAYAAASVYLRGALYDIAPWNSAAVAAVVSLIGFLAAVATAPAAHRAARIDPASALRSE